MNAKKKEANQNQLKISFFQPDISTNQPLPLYQNPVAAGFPSPAEDYAEKKLDLNEYLISNAPATFFVKVQGNSMVNAGILDGDILIVDKSKSAKHNAIVIAVIDNDFTVKRLIKKENRFYLQAENEAFPPIAIEEQSNAYVWGVVTFAIHHFK